MLIRVLLSLSLFCMKEGMIRQSGYLLRTIIDVVSNSANRKREYREETTQSRSLNLTNWCQFFMRLSCYWSWISSQHCQSSCRIRCISFLLLTLHFFIAQKLRPVRNEKKQKYLSSQFSSLQSRCPSCLTPDIPLLTSSLTWTLQ